MVHLRDTEVWRGQIAYMLKLAHFTNGATLSSCHTGLCETPGNKSIDNEQINTMSRLGD